MPTTRELKPLFRRIIQDNQSVDPYELRRVFTEAIREWEIEQGWGKLSAD